VDTDDQEFYYCGHMIFNKDSGAESREVQLRGIYLIGVAILYGFSRWRKGFLPSSYGLNMRSSDPMHADPSRSNQALGSVADFVAPIELPNHKAGFYR
jgi:hypothetical protein